MVLAFSRERNSAGHQLDIVAEDQQFEPGGDLLTHADTQITRLAPSGWAGLLVLLAVPPTLRRANRTGVMQDVIRQARENRAYYLGAVKTGLIRIYEVAPAGTSPSGNSGPMTDDKAMQIINAYGKAMMDRKGPFGDLSALPHPKARSKEVLIHGIKEADALVSRTTKAAYIALSEWQEGFEARAPQPNGMTKN